MSSIRQTNFSGGELAPAFHGRSDLAKYASGLRTCHNFFPTVGGRLHNRPGTKFVREVKTSSKGVRLIPFIHSETESYVLEFGQHPTLSQGYIRFHTNGGTVLSAGNPYEVVTTYLEVDVPRLKWSQVGDVMTIVHPDRGPAELTRIAADDWTWVALSLGSGQSASAPNPSSYFPDPSDHPPAILDTTVYAADATHFAREWIWQVTALVRFPSGLVTETKPYTVTQKFNQYPPTPRVNAALPADNLMVVYPDKAVRVDWIGDVGVSGNFEHLGYNVYRGRGKLMGFVGHTPNNWFYDYGDEPNYASPPPQGRDPFAVLNAAGTLIGYHLPATITHHQQRRFYGAGKNYTSSTFPPGYLWGSKVGDFGNFDQSFPRTDDQAVELELASNAREEVRWLLSLQRRLIVGTNSAIWSVSGSQGGPITPSSIEAHDVSHVGSSWLDPLVVHDVPVYVRTNGRGVQAIEFSTERDGFAAYDLAAFTHRLDGTGEVIDDWAWAREPYSLLWLVLQTGNLLSVTLNREQQVVAWAYHDSEAAAADFQRVCVVPEGGEDAVYFCVQRNVGGNKRYIERLQTRKVTDATQGIFLDCALTYSGAATTAISGLSHLDGKSVKALADGAVQGPFIVASGAITLTTAASLVHVGLPYVSEGELLDVASGKTEVKTRQLTTKAVALEVEASRGFEVAEQIGGTWEPGQFREVSDGYNPVALVTGLVEVPIVSSWNKGGRAAFRQTEPLPFTLLGVTREVEVGDAP